MMIASTLMAGALFFAQPAATDPSADLVKQGQARMREGKAGEAMGLFRQALEASPKSFQANVQMGVALDLDGEYEEARKHFLAAIEAAPAPQAKAQAQRSMAMSYAFENDCSGAAKYETLVYQWYLDTKDFYNAGEMADELARVCIEAGKLDEAYKWYQTGHDVGLREPGIKADRKDLWEFRWEHAQARVAARRGKRDEAQKHVEAAKAILDRGTNPQQVAFFPYLTGYVAFYAGDYKTAVADLAKANQDPFILCMMGQAYEKMGDKTQAMECYRKASLSTAHNPPNAFGHPFARKKLG